MERKVEPKGSGLRTIPRPLPIVLIVVALMVGELAGCAPRKVVRPVGTPEKATVATEKAETRGVFRPFSAIRSAILALIPGRVKGTWSVQEGIASWYGSEYHGRRTANGEIYNMHALTAAHRYLHFNTKVKVTNLSNGKSVVVRINDRGPFIRGRIIDLSYAAAKKIDMVETGVQKVKLVVLR